MTRAFITVKHFKDHPDYDVYHIINWGSLSTVNDDEWENYKRNASGRCTFNGITYHFNNNSIKVPKTDQDEVEMILREETHTNRKAMNILLAFIEQTNKEIAIERLNNDRTDR
jgi:hypothetical protein